MKIPKKFWTFTKPCHPTELGSAISCVESFHPHVLKPHKLWEADIILKNYVILVPFGYMHCGHQLYQVTLSLHQRKKCIKSCMVSSIHQYGRQGDEMSRFLPKIWMSLALLAGDQQCFGRWGAGVKISRCYYKVLMLIHFTKFIQN